MNTTVIIKKNHQVAVKETDASTNSVDANYQKKSVKYSYWNQFRAIFKLLFSVFLTDPFGIFLLFVFPVFFSVLWIILVEQGVVPEVPEVYVFNDPIKRWYEFSFFVIGLAGLFYIAIKFNQFRQTILFRRILIGGINKTLLSFFLLFFYWLMTLALVLIKVGLLFYYPRFRAEIKNVDLFSFVIGFLCFSITSVGLAFFIGSLPIRSTTTVSILSIFFLLFFLLLSGLILDIELFLIDFKNLRGRSGLIEPYVNIWEKVNFSSKVWRIITFFSPFQPSIFIVKNAHINQDWKIPLDILGTEMPSGIKFYRPMPYENFSQVILMNFAWMIMLFGLGTYFFQKNK